MHQEVSHSVDFIQNNAKNNSIYYYVQKYEVITCIFVGRIPVYKHMDL